MSHSLYQIAYVITVSLWLLCFLLQYYQRGFDAYIIDPYCSHDEQCVKEDEIVHMKPSHVERNDDEIESEIALEAKQPDFAAANVRVQTVTLKGDNKWRSRDFHTTGEIDAIKRAQDQDGGWVGNLICNLRDNNEVRNHDTYLYTAALIEKSPRDATEYFAKRDNWSEEQRKEVLELPEHQRFVCRNCRKDYGLRLLLEKAPAILTSVGNVEDVFKWRVVVPTRSKHAVYAVFLQWRLLQQLFRWGKCSFISSTDLCYEIPTQVGKSALPPKSWDK